MESRGSFITIYIDRLIDREETRGKKKNIKEREEKEGTRNVLLHQTYYIANEHRRMYTAHNDK